MIKPPFADYHRAELERLVLEGFEQIEAEAAAACKVDPFSFAGSATATTSQLGFQTLVAANEYLRRTAGEHEAKAAGPKAEHLGEVTITPFQALKLLGGAEKFSAMRLGRMTMAYAEDRKDLIERLNKSVEIWHCPSSDDDDVFVKQSDGSVVSYSPAIRKMHKVRTTDSEMELIEALGETLRLHSEIVPDREWKTLTLRFRRTPEILDVSTLSITKGIS